MGFFKPAPGLEDKPDLNKPTIYSKEYRHAIVDSEYTPHTSLLHNVSGLPVRCDYYRQYSGQSEELIGLQLNDISTYQSYTEIRHLVYKRDGDKSRNWDSERYEVNETWNGYFIFDLIPLKGDILVEDIGDGRAGLVQIMNTPEPMSTARDKVYLCECKLLAEMTQEIEDNIRSKVVETSWFSAESALKGGHAIITANDRKLNEQLDRWAYMISQHLLTNHYWNPERTIAIRDDKEFIYDPYLVRYLQRVIPHKYIPGANPIESLNFTVGRNYNYDKEMTIWDCFTQGSFDFLPMIDRKLYKYNRLSMMNTRGYTGFLATKFDYIVLPNKLEFNELNQLYRARDNGLAYRPPVEEPVEYQNYFSEEFYNGSYNNEFERWCKDFFGERTVDREQLLKLCQDYAKWEPIDQIYRAGLLVSAIMISKRVFGG